MAAAEAEGLFAAAPASRTRCRPKHFLADAGIGTASKRAKSVQLVSELAAFSNWVSCDNCDKWRRVAQEPTADKWYCSDNLDAGHNACSLPQEMSDAAIDIELNQIQTAAIDTGGTVGVSEAAPRQQQGKCEHGRRRIQCKECGGANICQHGRQRSRCKECAGASICQHGRERNGCKECGGGSICQHGWQRSQCKECGGANIC